MKTMLHVLLGLKKDTSKEIEQNIFYQSSFSLMISKRNKCSISSLARESRRFLYKVITKETFEQLTHKIGFRRLIDDCLHEGEKYICFALFFSFAMILFHWVFLASF